MNPLSLNATYRSLSALAAKSGILHISLITISLGFMHSAVAIEDDEIADGNQFYARGKTLIQMIEPSLTTYVRFDEIDEDQETTRDATLIALQPRFRLALQQSNWHLVSQYSLEFGEYVSGDFENFLDHEFRSDWGYRLSRENQFNIGMVYRKWQNRWVDQAIEDFNSGLTDPFSHESLAFDFS